MDRVTFYSPWRMQTRAIPRPYTVTEPQSSKENSDRQDCFAESDSSSRGWSDAIAIGVVIIIVGIVFYAIHLGHYPELGP